MKTISKAIFIGALAIFMGLSANLKAQVSRQQINEVISKLQQIIVLCNQAEAKAQQVEVFAMNGNASQLPSRIAAINSDLTSMDFIAQSVISGPIVDRIQHVNFSAATSTFRSAVRAWYNASGIIIGNNGTYPTVAGAAGELGLALGIYNNGTTEIRVAICCASV